MKLRVQREDGKFETLVLETGQWTVIEAEQLNRLSGSGTEHFFTQSGHYDGWGTAANDTEPEDEAKGERRYTREDDQ